MLHSFQSRIHDKLLTVDPQLKVGADRRHGKHRNRLGQSGLEYERRRLNLCLEKEGKPDLKQSEGHC